MIRSEYWNKSKEMLEYCSDEELKVLSQQATKALDRRMSAYLGKMKAKDKAKAMAAKKAVKAKLKVTK